MATQTPPELQVTARRRNTPAGTYTYRITKSDNSTWFEESANPYPTREAALAASRAKSEFLSSMSHEIRTPMNAILGMADLLAEGELGDEQRRYVNTLIGNGNALLELINGILDLAKVESGRISLECSAGPPGRMAMSTKPAASSAVTISG